jgi:hypothetical protein
MVAIWHHIIVSFKFSGTESVNWNLDMNNSPDWCTPQFKSLAFNKMLSINLPVVILYYTYKSSLEEIVLALSGRLVEK